MFFRFFNFGNFTVPTPTSGFAHLSCLVNFARKKYVRQWDEVLLEQEREEYDEIYPNEFKRPWGKCPNCKQLYQGRLAVDLSVTCVAFVEGRYPNDNAKLLKALILQLEAFQRILDCLTKYQKER